MYLFTIGGCKVETTKSLGLSAKDAVFAEVNEAGKLVPVTDSVFERGDKIALVMMEVKTFKLGEDGKHWMDMDMEVTGPDGEVVLSGEGIFGEKGHIVLQNGIAKNPYGTFPSTLDNEPGEYRIKVTIKDRVGGGSVSKSKALTLE